MTDAPQIIDKEQLLSCFQDKQRVTMRRMLFLYGGDVNAVLNALLGMAARLAASTGVDADKFAQGVAHHWDGVNAPAEPQRLDS